MTQKSGKKQPLRPGKKESGLSSSARVERRKKGAGRKTSGGSMPKEKKGAGGSRDGGLH